MSIRKAAIHGHLFIFQSVEQSYNDSFTKMLQQNILALVNNNKFMEALSKFICSMKQTIVIIWIIDYTCSTIL